MFCYNIFRQVKENQGDLFFVPRPSSLVPRPLTYGGDRFSIERLRLYMCLSGDALCTVRTEEQFLRANVKTLANAFAKEATGAIEKTFGFSNNSYALAA